MDTLLDMDSALDQNLDSVETAADYIQPDDGMYHLTIEEVKLEHVKRKDKDTGQEIKKPQIKVVWKKVKTVELKEGSNDVADNTMFTEQFSFPEGLPYFKRLAAKALGEDAIAGVSLKDIMSELANNHTFVVIVVNRETESDDGKKKYRNTSVRIQEMIS